MYFVQLIIIRMDMVSANAKIESIYNWFLRVLVIFLGHSGHGFKSKYKNSIFFYYSLKETVFSNNNSS